MNKLKKHSKTLIDTLGNFGGEISTFKKFSKMSLNCKDFKIHVT